MINRDILKNNTSGYKGVSWLKKDCRWLARIGDHGIRKYLGTFICKHEAARVYNLAARMYHGHEFAYTNIIQEESTNERYTSR